MEQKIAPTSPKSEHRKGREEKKQQRSKPNSHVIFIAIVFSLLLGSLSGFFGFFIASNLPADFPVFGQFNVLTVLEERSQSILLSTRRQERSIVYQSPQVIEQVFPVYTQAPTLENADTFAGNAVAVTSDGWLAMSSLVFPFMEDGSINPTAVAILPEGKTAPIEKQTTDEFAGITFFKIEASNIPFADFSVDDTILVGQSLSVIEKRVGSYVVYERRVAGEQDQSQSVRSTQRLDHFMVLDVAKESNHIGSPVFFNNGTLAGILQENGAIIQGSLLAGALQSVIAHNTVVRSTQDVSYINCSRLTDDEKERLEITDNGLYITDVVVGDGQEQQLQEGDIIVSVNNTFVDEFTDLAALVHSRPAAAMLYLTVERDDAELFIEYEL